MECCCAESSENQVFILQQQIFFKFKSSVKIWYMCAVKIAYINRYIMRTLLLRNGSTNPTNVWNFRELHVLKNTSTSSLCTSSLCICKKQVLRTQHLWVVKTGNSILWLILWQSNHHILSCEIHRLKRWL